MKTARTLAALVAAALLGPVAAGADPTPKPEPPRKAAPRKVVRPQELKVEGKVERPKASAVLPPPAGMAAEREPTDSLLPRILDAAEKEPF